MLRLVGRIAKWSGLTLAALLVAALTLAVWYVRAVDPQVAGTLAVPGIDRDVEVVRDREGVPHIFARSEADAMAALGFAHAQDRLWQMEAQRRIAAGRLSEVVGSGGLELDRFLRTIGIRRAAEAILGNVEPETRRLLEAYSRGVNAYLETRTSPLPPEFLILGAPAPEPWSPVDSIAWSLMMALDLGANMNAELTRMRLAQAGWDMKRIGEFLPPYPGESWPELADFTALYRSLGPAATASAQTIPALGFNQEGLGSNNWVMSGARTISGRPLLANDPHLGLAAPAVWYFARITSPEGTVIGATLPGAPGVVLGRNERIAWGFTNTGPDVQDIYVEQVNPADPMQYRTPDGWARFERRDEAIKVKGQPDVRFSVRISRHGPVISDGASEAATRVAPSGYALALRWTALAPDNLTIQATPRMNRARNWTEFLEAAKHFAAPQQNMVYADVDGNIGFVAAGRVPVRKPENDLKGLFPAPGWDARYDWAGYIPFEALPREFNPARGFRMTANERITPEGYPHHITYEWTTAHRAERIVELLGAREKHDTASMRDTMADVRSNAVLEVLPRLTAAMPTGEREQRAVELLRRWNATMAADRPEPLIVTAWMRELTRLVYGDELGETLMRTLWDQRQTFMVNVLGDVDGQGRWCRTSEQATTCAALIQQALRLALDDLTRRYGSDIAAWRWGEAHAARSEHRPFARVGALARFFDVRVPTGGDTYTVNVGRHTIRNAEEPFINRHAASLRAIYDLANLDASRFMHSTGQSGLPFSAFYRNFAERWSRVEFIAIPMERTVVERDKLGTLLLRPR